MGPCGPPWCLRHHLFCRFLPDLHSFRPISLRIYQNRLHNTPVITYSSKPLSGRPLAAARRRPLSNSRECPLPRKIWNDYRGKRGLYSRKGLSASKSARKQGEGREQYYSDLETRYSIGLFLRSLLT
jgi:hypothetical protein